MAIQKIAIVGTGQMGAGIAQVCATKGFETVLIKATAGDPSPAESRIHKGLDKLVTKGKIDEGTASEIKGRLTVTGDMNAASDADLVIESVLEEIDLKAELFQRLEGICKETTLLATNTSTLSVTELASRVERPQNVVGLHFFNPAVVMKLVEIIPTVHTAQAVIDELNELCVTLGKGAVLVGDKTGFIVNRLLTPYMVDAIRTLQEGLATVEDIDSAMKMGCGHPMGPLELADYIGLDIVEHMASNLVDEYKEARLAPPPILKRLVLAGQLGRKSGKGFYDYSDGQQPRNELVR